MDFKGTRGKWRKFQLPNGNIVESKKFSLFDRAVDYHRINHKMNK